MEVRCSNCETEYEFDDALVSARGTSVKCTQCGHQFRVRRAGAEAGAAESWLVRTEEGQEINFKSLRELQQGIVQGVLGEKDSLTHGGQPARPLKDIYELQTFFASARARAAHPVPKRTLLGGAGGLPLPRPSSLPPPRKRPDPVTPVGGIGAVTKADAARTGTATIPPGHSVQAPGQSIQSGPPAPAQSSSPVSAEDATSYAPKGLPGATGSVPAPSAVARVSVPPAPRLPAEAMQADLGLKSNPDAGRASSPAAAGSVSSDPPGRGNTLSSELGGAPQAPGVQSASAAPWHNMQGLRGSESELPPLAGVKRGARSRWIAALVVVGGLALFASTVGKDYILQFAQPEAPAPVVDHRIPKLLEEAELALGRRDFEAARVALAKADVLADRDATVTAALAQLELAQAETHWIQLKVLKELAVESKPAKRLRSARARAEAELKAQQLAAEREALHLAATQGLSDRLGKARTALERGASRPEPPSTAAAASIEPREKPLAEVRARVNLLRMEGKLTEARGSVRRLAQEASQADNAHALGALDLAEEGAGLLAAIGRLKVAARSESALGNAHSLLIYALARSGDRAAAAAELSKLRLVSAQHPLLDSLGALVEQLPEAAAPASEPQKEASSKSRSPERAESAPSRRSPPRRARQSVSSRSVAAPDDDLSAVEKAERLHRAGDLAGAERLYDTVLGRTPTHIGALSGMGDIFRQRGETAKAMAYYNRVLARQPNHLRTVMASADMNWAAKREEAAVNLYRRALGQVGTSHPYGARALRRIEQFEKRAAETPSPVTPSPEPPAQGAVPAPQAPPPAAAPPAVPAPQLPSTNPPGLREPKKPAAKPHPFAIPPTVTAPPQAAPRSTAPNSSP